MTDPLFQFYIGYASISPRSVNCFLHRLQVGYPYELSYKHKHRVDSPPPHTTTALSPARRDLLTNKTTMTGVAYINNNKKMYKNLKQ